jgi:cell wall-associated NlpC family hydrolase
LQTAQKQADRAVADVEGARNAAAASHAQLQASYTQVKGQVATLVAQVQAAKAQQDAVAAAAAAQQRQAAAAAAARAGGGRSSAAPLSLVVPSPGPVGRGAGAAVSAALSRVGMPYVWGASGPNSFDCSGLTMWAWGQAGVSLPHFSGAQYASTQHIPMSQVQPGDLVFPSDTGTHMAMYIGGGQIVEAAHSGVPVRVTSLRSDFVLASRP